jgi:hypothetical protein
MSGIEQLVDSTQAFYDTLVVNYERAKLPEDLFVRNFLPFFLGKIDIKTNPDFLPTWISIAGSPSAEVEIIDTRGKVLFTVPAFIDSTIIGSKDETGGFSFADIVRMGKLYGNITPSLGANTLKDGFADKLSRLSKKSEVFDKNKQTWEIIFSRYIKPEESNQTGLSAKKSTTSNVSDDDFE